MAKKVTLMLSDAAQKVIDDNATERTRGEWVSGVIEGWATVREVEGVGTIERLEARIVRLQDEVGRLVGVRG